MKKTIKKFPVVRDIGLALYALWQMITFKNSSQYWKDRYRSGGSSGSGSYGLLADYKAGVLNKFVSKNNIETVIEFGCGDGNQLSLACYPTYFGLDISEEVVRKCIEMYRGDRSKGFMCYCPPAFDNKCRMLRADLSLSLDVVYHLVEDSVYEKYLCDLFQASEKWVVIYTSSASEKSVLRHVRHRDVVVDVARCVAGWVLDEKIENPHAYSKFDDEKTSFADFYVFKKIAV